MFKMRLENLLSVLDIKKIKGNKDIQVRDICYDSRKINPGDIFVCIKGLNTDGHLYIDDAVKRGAKVIVSEKWIDRASSVTQVLVSNARIALARLSRAFFKNPQEKLKLVGVTGTNGKTTTTYLIKSMLDLAGKRTSLLGTVEYKIVEKNLPLERTTPESYDLHKLFYEMVKENVETVVMEVSSHAIHLHRVHGLEFAVMVFTNLTPEHLDYHLSIDEYFRVKKSFFEGEFGGDTKVVNVDDPYGQEIAQVCQGKVYGYGLKDSPKILARQVRSTPRGNKFEVVSPVGVDDISTRLQGLFNVYNILAAYGTGLAFNLNKDTIKQGLERVTNVPGRFESVDCGQDFSVIVDYAHTPDSLEKAITAAKHLARGKVITVFGCGGDRDKQKRPLMGKVSGDLSNRCIITSDNPRSESPLEIMKQIEQGIKEVKGAGFEKIADRKKAIFKAISEAKNGDLVLIAGKGHEKTQTFKDKVISFDDCEVAKEALKEVIK